MKQLLSFSLRAAWILVYLQTSISVFQASHSNRGQGFVTLTVSYDFRSHNDVIAGDRDTAPMCPSDRCGGG